MKYLGDTFFTWSAHINFGDGVIDDKALLSGAVNYCYWSRVEIFCYMLSIF